MSTSAEDPAVVAVRELLDAGKINPKDQWLAEALVRRTPEPTPAQLGWLGSLAARGGAPFDAEERKP